MRAFLLPFLLLAGCGPGSASTAYEACLDNLDVLCTCDDATGGPEGWACDLSDDERATACEEFKDGGDQSGDDWRDWYNCGNRALASGCEVTDDEQAECDALDPQ